MTEGFDATYLSSDSLHLRPGVATGANANCNYVERGNFIHSLGHREQSNRHVQLYLMGGDRY